MHINNLYIKFAKSHRLRKNLGIKKSRHLAKMLSKTMQLENTPGQEDPQVKSPQGVLDPRERQKQLKLPVQAGNRFRAP
jgi:hypothetical protein